MISLIIIKIYGEFKVIPILNILSKNENSYFSHLPNDIINIISHLIKNKN